MKNPKWCRDEIILALDLYYQKDRGPIEARNPKIIQLSELLNQLPLFSSIPDIGTFRNPNGVGLKLSNFLAIDPEYKGKGMEAYSKLDKEVFDEFVDDRERLHNIAKQIKRIASDQYLKQYLSKIEDDEVILTDSAREGQVLYKLHKYRERDRKIITAKKNAVFKATQKLTCEACSFDFSEAYGELGDGFIECHHIKPISSYDEISETRLEDLALVCANCHRMLHRGGLMSIKQLKGILKTAEVTV